MIINVEPAPELSNLFFRLQPRLELLNNLLNPCFSEWNLTESNSKKNIEVLSQTHTL